MTKQIILRFALFCIVGLFGNKSTFSQTVDTLKTLNEKEVKEWYVFEMAMFQGGSLDEFTKYVRKEIKYPMNTLWTKHNRHVKVQFIVTKKGKVDSVVFLNSSGINKIDNNIASVMTDSKGWRPARHNGEPVDEQYEIILKIR